MPCYPRRHVSAPRLARRDRRHVRAGGRRRPAPRERARRPSRPARRGARARAAVPRVPAPPLPPGGREPAGRPAPRRDAAALLPGIAPGAGDVPPPDGGQPRSAHPDGVPGPQAADVPPAVRDGGFAVQTCDRLRVAEPDPADESVLDVRTPAPGETIEADVCVVGSGAGGGVAAAILAAAGKKVVVLERAANVTEGGFGGPELEGLARLFLDRGLTATDDRWFSIRAGSAVGGGTVVNWSSSIRLPDAIREEWRAAGHRRPRPPLRRGRGGDLRHPWRERAERSERRARPRPRRARPRLPGHPPQRPGLHRLRPVRGRLPQRSEAVRAPDLPRRRVRARGDDPRPDGGAPDPRA